MKKRFYHIVSLWILFFAGWQFSLGQPVPEILYYKFNGTSTTVPNMASLPPSGAEIAGLFGSLLQGSSGVCSGYALVGPGGSSKNDFLNTGWNPVISSSWTIAFWTNNFYDTSYNTYYIFGEKSAGGFGCYTGFGAGYRNWLLTGPFTSVLLLDGASPGPAFNAFVYDSAAKKIYAYLNGNLVNTVNQSSAITLNGTAPLKVGGSDAYDGMPLNSLLDEFRFYSRALSPKEIKALNNVTWDSLKVTVCDSFVSPTKKFTWKVTGNYSDTLTNANGCDSIIYVNLTVNKKEYDTIAPVVCYSYTSPSQKHTWTTAGQYIDTIPTTGGCDSVITINLTIKNGTTSVISPSVCNTYKSPSGKYTWTNSGLYTDTIPATNGCDSIITIILTVKKNTVSLINPVVCYTYNSPSTKYTWTNSGVYTDTIPNNDGCDSIITINLLVYKTTTSSIFIQSCFSYTSPSGKYTWTTSGTYRDTIASGVGCDSIITINLLINVPNITVTRNGFTLTAAASPAAYQWLNCTNSYAVIPGETNAAFVVTANGSYAVQVTQNSCVDTSACIAITDVGIGEIGVNRYTIYPNPSGGQITIAAPALFTNATVRIINIAGQVVLEKGNFSGNTITVDINNEATGIYFVEIEEQGNISKIKLVKF